jgi:hypothetical protein
MQKGKEPCRCLNIPGQSLHFVIVQDDQETIADEYSVEVYPTVL